MVGLLTLEDIVEEIIADELEDEFDPITAENEKKDKVQRNEMKLKLIELFKDHDVPKVLNEDEIVACLEYLSKYVKPFMPGKIKRDVLNVLIRQS